MKPDDNAVVIDKAGPTRKVKYGSMSRDRAWALRWSYFFLALFAIFSLVPPLYMLITSLKSSAEISAATNPWWVFHPTLSNYVELLTSNQFLRFFWNSAMVSIIVVTVTMLISVPAAFALARMKFWGSATLATGVFLTYLIPDTLLFIPLFKMFAVVRRLDRDPADQPMVCAAAHLPDAHRAVLHLDHDRLFRLDPEGAR